MPERTPRDARGAAATGGRASTHFDFRDWAIGTLGDERQVYARSTDSQRHLVFLPDGEADCFREAARAGQLVCPVPGCPSPALTTRGPRSRRHHFVHLQAPPDPEHQRLYEARVATELIAEWIGAAHPRSEVQTDVITAGIRVAALIKGPSGSRFAIVFVDRRMGPDAWWEADRALEDEGLARGWIFSPRPFLRQPRPSKDAGPDDPAVLDRERGDIVLDRPVFREMRRAGKWPLLININTRELANLIVPGRAIARQLGLAPPASGDRVLHLHPAPLADCRLCQDGIATPGVSAEVLAAPRLARERDQLYESRALAHSPQPAATGPPAVQPLDAEVRINFSRAAAMLDGLDAALDSGGGATTLASLIEYLGSENKVDEPHLKELLYNLRIESVIEFKRPLRRDSTIRRR